MSVNIHSFSLGRMACTVLLDGSTVIGRDGVVKRFRDASEADYRRAFADIGLSLDEAVSSLNVLAVQLDGELILVDAGEGGQPRGGHVLASMAQAGIAPEAVTKVIITHTHGDHVQGLVTSEGEPVYRNAVYFISEEEMAFWQGRIENGSADHGTIVRMLESRGLHLIDMDEAIMPGVTAVPAPGHTPGHIGLLFESDGEKLLHLADTLHNPMQFGYPEWSPSFDADASVSVPTRRTLLGRAADEGALTLFYHLPFPGLGRVRRSGNAFTWEAGTPNA